MFVSRENMEKKIESHYLPLLLTLQIRQPNKKNSSLRWNTNSIRNWNPNNKIKTKTKQNKTKQKSKKEEEAKWFGLNLQKIQSKTKTHIQSERENRSERKGGSEWEKDRESTIAATPNHHAIAVDLQTTTLSPPIFSPYCQFWSPIHVDLRDP